MLVSPPFVSVASCIFLLAFLLSSAFVISYFLQGILFSKFRRSSSCCFVFLVDNTRVVKSTSACNFPFFSFCPSRTKVLEASGERGTEVLAYVNSPTKMFPKDISFVGKHCWKNCKFDASFLSNLSQGDTNLDFTRVIRYLHITAARLFLWSFAQ